MNDAMQDAGLGVDQNQGLRGEVAEELRRHGYVRPAPTARRRLAAALFIAVCLVAGAYVIVTLAEFGWRMLP